MYTTANGYYVDARPELCELCQRSAYRIVFLPYSIFLTLAKCSGE